MSDDKTTGLKLMREPFLPNQISKLPKPTKRQTDAQNAAMNNKDFSLGIRCEKCGQWHHKDVVHLDYVGHAALTDRLLDCDDNWNWTPVKTDDQGAPVMDNNGGMWISLTVCGVTRLGYGDAQGKQGGNAIKEVIGDALRNAAMRFGAALDLWHKGELHVDDEPITKGEAVGAMTRQSGPETEAKAQQAPATAEETRDRIIAAIARATKAEELLGWRGRADVTAAIDALPEPMRLQVSKAHEERYSQLRPEIEGDGIPDFDS